MLAYQVLIGLIIFCFNKMCRTNDNLDGDKRLWDYRGNDRHPNYDIINWVKMLHLQQCVIVEIGEGFCALFVEMKCADCTSNQRNNSGADELFLGHCKCATFRTWNFCSAVVNKRRQVNCVFSEATPFANSSARVHRRLCDVTLLSTEASLCDCSARIAGQQLYKTTGFPTCFLDPLPQSLCYPRNVCGTGRCLAATAKGIFSPLCDPHCYQKQPFCEEIGPWTSLAPVITSFWARHSTSKCNSTCGKGYIKSTDVCLDQVTMKPALDCIGLPTFCCSEELGKCMCEISLKNGILKASIEKSCFSTNMCNGQHQQHAKRFLTEAFSEKRPSDTFKEFKYEENKCPTYRRLLAGMNDVDDNDYYAQKDDVDEDYQAVDEKSKNDENYVTEDYEGEQDQDEGDEDDNEEEDDLEDDDSDNNDNDMSEHMNILTEPYDYGEIVENGDYTMHKKRTANAKVLTTENVEYCDYDDTTLSTKEPEEEIIDETTGGKVENMLCNVLMNAFSFIIMWIIS